MLKPLHSSYSPPEEKRHGMKRFVLLQALLIATLIPVDLHAHFERAQLGTRSIALGGMFVPLGDDPSALFSNVSGLVTADVPTIYGDYAESPDPRYDAESRIAALYPYRRFAAATGWYRRGGGEAGDEDLIVGGIAATLLTNTQGAFLSAGAAVKVGMVSYESGCDCAEGGTTETGTTFDIGIMFRPLPVVSVAYVLSNASDIEFGPPGEEELWERSQRWGIAYFWEGSVAVGYEYERVGERTIHHYGFSVRTSTPIELLAGFSRERLSGGIRWIGGRVRLAASFGTAGGDGIHAGASVEFGLGSSDGD